MWWGFTTASAELWLQSYAQIKGGRGNVHSPPKFLKRGALFIAPLCD